VSDTSVAFRERDRRPVCADSLMRRAPPSWRRHRRRWLARGQLAPHVPRCERGNCSKRRVYGPKSMTVEWSGRTQGQKSSARIGRRPTQARAPIRYLRVPEASEDHHRSLRPRRAFGPRNPRRETTSVPRSGGGTPCNSPLTRRATGNARGTRLRRSREWPRRSASSH